MIKSPIKNFVIHPVMGDYYVPNNCVLWHNYKLDKGGKVIDLSGRHNNGTVSGALPIAQGRSFDGTDDYIQIADSTATRLSSGGTLAVWVYPKSAGEPSGRIIDKGTDTSATNGYNFYINLTKQLGFTVNAGVALVSSLDSIVFSKWQYVAVTFDNTGRKLYINAIDVTLTGGTETALPPDVAGVVAIGNRAGATDRSFDGYIRDVKIFTRALTQPEISALYQQE